MSTSRETAVAWLRANLSPAKNTGGHPSQSPRLNDALASASEATWDLARSASEPATRLSRQFLDVAGEPDNSRQSGDLGRCIRPLARLVRTRLGRPRSKRSNRSAIAWPAESDRSHRRPARPSASCSARPLRNPTFEPIHPQRGEPDAITIRNLPAAIDLQRVRLLTLFCVLLAAAPASTRSGPCRRHPKLDTLLRLVPPDAAVVLTVEGLREQLQAFTSSRLFAGLKQLPTVKTWIESEKSQQLGAHATRSRRCSVSNSMRSATT